MNIIVLCTYHDGYDNTTYEPSIDLYRVCGGCNPWVSSGTNMPGEGLFRVMLPCPTYLVTLGSLHWLSSVS